MKAPGAGRRSGAGNFVTTLDASSVPHPVADAQAGKWIAMVLCNSGVSDMGATVAAFALHPEWEAA